MLPVLRQFEPDLIIVSAGFDAHERDPLGGMRLSTAAFAAMTRRAARASPTNAAAAASCSVTEGGYDLRALAASLDAVIEAHAAPASTAAVTWPASGIASTRGAAATAEVRREQAAFWTL